MCTASWICTGPGYELFFNRDELRSRGLAGPPRTDDVSGLACMYPVDSDAGGTWIGVNEAGFGACLLNYYSSDQDAGTPASEYASRGLLLKSLLGCRTRNQAIELISHDTLPRYRGFTVLLFEPGQRALLARWNARGLIYVDDPAVPQSSSSFKTDEVIASRKALLAERYNHEDTSALMHYHHSHQPEKGPFSVCMHRSDAKTVSFSHIVVSEQEVSFSYTPGSPCKTPSLAPATLRREG